MKQISSTRRSKAKFS